MNEEQDIVEQLLKPRYKAIADYPLSDKYFNVGDILYWNEKYESYRIDEKQVAMNKKTVEDYPHLFKKLAWWEERKESEMPLYIKTEKGRILKVLTWFKDIDYDMCFNKADDELGWNLHTYPCLPATKAEYLEQNQKPQ